MLIPEKLASGGLGDAPVTTIVIFTRTLIADGYPFSSKYLWNAYLDLMLAIKARGAQAYFASGMGSYAGGGVFRRAYTAGRKVGVSEFELARDVKADLVFEKGGFTGRDMPVINQEFVSKIAGDKAETYRLFGKYQPVTVMCNGERELRAAIKQLPGDRVVLKAPVSNKGREVWIGSKAEAPENLPAGYPLLVQEFLDTSVGVPGLAAGVHDVRVKIAGGKILGGMVRIPAPGELRANVDQGGSARHLYLDELPTAAVKMAGEIDCYFERYPRYYAIDMANTPWGWKLIELNNKPGLSPIALSAQAKHVTESLADYLISEASHGPLPPNQAAQ